jgi:hypothetical protein
MNKLISLLYHQSLYSFYHLRSKFKRFGLNKSKTSLYFETEVVGRKKKSVSTKITDNRIGSEHSSVTNVTVVISEPPKFNSSTPQF